MDYQGQFFRVPFIDDVEEISYFKVIDLPLPVFVLVQAVVAVGESRRFQDSHSHAENIAAREVQTLWISKAFLFVVELALLRG